jgi:hypothetical protein
MRNFGSLKSSLEHGMIIFRIVHWRGNRWRVILKPRFGQRGVPCLLEFFIDYHYLQSHYPSAWARRSYIC